MIIEFGNQKVEINIEEPEGLDKKNPTNNFFLYKYGMNEDNSIKITFEERIYKLERDEQAILESLKQIKTGTGINSFLMKGGQDSDQYIKKKKVYQA